MKCTELPDILKQNKQTVSGNKQILVARCYALTPVIDERKNVALSAETVDESDAQDDSFDPLFQLKSANEIGFNEINLTAKGRQWETDLRLFPLCNFHQLHEYLVVRTHKYGDDMMKGVSYKKMKSYKFFQEGHIKSYEIARGYGNVWVKSKVMASMKHEIYRGWSSFVMTMMTFHIGLANVQQGMFHLRTMIQHVYHACKLL